MLRKLCKLSHLPVNCLPYMLTFYIMTVQVSKQDSNIDAILLSKLQSFFSNFTTVSQMFFASPGSNSGFSCHALSFQSPQSVYSVSQLVFD